MAAQQPAGQPTGNPAAAPAAPAGNPATGTTNTNPQGEDYLDKGLDKVEQMFGKKSGHNMDSNKMRGTNEKITDKIRDTFEKATGKHVPEKFSN